MQQQGEGENPEKRVAITIIINSFIMITLEKLLTELKAESLNEIVAGCGSHHHGGHKGGHKGGKSSSSSSSSGKNYHGGCGCTPPPPPPVKPPCGPSNHGCQ